MITRCPCTGGVRGQQTAPKEAASRLVANEPTAPKILTSVPGPATAQHLKELNAIQVTTGRESTLLFDRKLKVLRNTPMTVKGIYALFGFIRVLVKVLVTLARFLHY